MIPSREILFFKAAWFLWINNDWTKPHYVCLQRAMSLNKKVQEFKDFLLTQHKHKKATLNNRKTNKENLLKLDSVETSDGVWSNVRLEFPEQCKVGVPRRKWGLSAHWSIKDMMMNLSTTNPPISVIYCYEQDNLPFDPF